MKAITYKFDGGTTNFQLLIKAFINSWEQNSNIELIVYNDDPPEVGHRNPGFYHNHQKLIRWYELFIEHKQDLIFTDCDMICMDDISCGFEMVDHIGVCEANEYPFNGGVVFIKNTRQSHEFFKDWLDIDTKMLDEYIFHFPYLLKYAGINQSSFGYLYENGHKDLISVLPNTYNLCQPWKDWQEAKMIHIKSELRANIMQAIPNTSPEIKQITDIFWRYASQTTATV